MERIVLVGGPWSGEIHDIEPDAPEVTRLDYDGTRSVYLRAERVALAHGTRVTLFRPAGPAPEPS